MIEMPLNRAAEGPAAAPAAADTPADAPQGAFEEMLSRSLGRRLVGRYGGSGQQSNQDAAQGNGQGETQFYQGMVVTSWTPQAIEEVVDPTFVPEAAAGAVASTTIPLLPPPAPQATNALPGSDVADVAMAMPAASVSQAPAIQGAPAPLAQGETALPLAAPIDATVTSPAAVAPEVAPAITEQASPQRAAAPSLRAVTPPANPAAPAAQSSQTVTTAPTQSSVPTVATGVETAGAASASKTEPSQASNVMVAAAPVVTETRRPAERAVDTAPESGTAAIGSTTGTTTGATPPASVPAVPTSQHAALVNRVLQMVEHQQTQPPPRMVVVDMPELEGLRLMVALQADGKVHVAPIVGSAPAQVAEPFVTAVGEALAADGFDLADSGENEKRQRRDIDEQVPAPRRHGRRARRARRSSGLRL